MDFKFPQFLPQNRKCNFRVSCVNLITSPNRETTRFDSPPQQLIITIKIRPINLQNKIGHILREQTLHQLWKAHMAMTFMMIYHAFWIPLDRMLKLPDPFFQKKKKVLPIKNNSLIKSYKNKSTMLPTLTVEWTPHILVNIYFGKYCRFSSNSHNDKQNISLLD